MKALLIFRNRIEEFYHNHAEIVNYVIRLVLTFLVLLTVKNATGYNTILSQMWFILCFAVVAAFVNWRVLPVVLGIYVIAQMLTLSLGIGVIFIVVMAIVYLLYFRVDKRYAAVILIMPLLMTIKLTPLVPLILAVIAPAVSLISVVCASVIYYMVHFVSINVAVIQGFEGVAETEKASFLIDGMANYKDFIYTTLIMVLVFLLAYYMRKIRANRANEIAVALGAGFAIILQLIVQLVGNTMTYQKLWMIVIFGIISAILAVIVNYFILPLDFTRTETAEFQDEEYYYYVRAVPKASIDKESVHITRISNRKKGVHLKGKTDRESENI